MIESQPARPDTALLQEVRDGIALRFGDAIAAAVPAVVEVLEQQLMQSPERTQWKTLKGAISMLRDGGRGIGQHARTSLAARFDAKLKPGADSLGQTARFSLESLSLVADDEMQEEIVLGNATRRLKDQCDEELFSLTRRLAAVLARDNLPDEMNPVFPRVFTRALLDAISKGGIDPQGQLAAFAAFGPAMLEVVPQCYAETNRLLRERGVMPDFRKSYGSVMNPESRVRGGDPGLAGSLGTGALAPPAPGAHATVASSAAAVPADPTAALFERLVSGAGSAAASAPAAPTVPGLVTIQVRPELLAALRSLELRMPAPTVAATVDPDAFIAAEPLYPVVIPHIKREMGATLTPSDAVVADLVAAIFERLFADVRLADAFKAQVGRLQLPVFKAAMQDRAFFTDRKHPIRALIDVMAQLGGAEASILVDGKAPVAWVAAAVERVVLEHGEDPGTFARASRHLGEILERHAEASLDHDEDVQVIRRREVQLDGMREATLAIAHRLAASHYAPHVADYLYRSWREVMVFDYLAGGEDSADWKADIEALDDLLWIMTPRFTLPERERMVSLLPSLAFRVRLGHVRAGMDGDRSAALVEEMKELHEELTRSRTATTPGRPLRKAPPAEATVPSPDDYTATLSISSATLAEEGLYRGAWFEFIDSDGERHRCRLNWMSPVQGTCLFKDLDKNRSFAIGLLDLRERRRQGTVLVVDGPGVAQASIEGAIADVAGGLV